jgi:hypothetical protein
VKFHTLAPLIALLLALSPARAQAPDPDRAAALADHVDFAIRRGVAYLYSQQRPDGRFNSANFEDEAGPTALALMALHAAGEPPTKPGMRAGYDFLRKSNPRTTYSLSLKVAALSQVSDVARDQSYRREVSRLIAMQIDGGPHRGLYGYYMPAGTGGFADLSNSQYGVLGVWYAAEAGVEVPRAYWERVENAWIAAQRPDGGFDYRPGMGSSSYGSMTAAGVATLAITHDFLHAASAGGAQGRAAARVSRSAAASARGTAWLDQFFLVDRNPGRDIPLAEIDRDRRDRGLASFGQGSYVHYMLFGYERVGEATGLTRFGLRRWYEDGARYLVATQLQSGEWAGSFPGGIDTSYALLFLARGRAPVVIQKLEFDGRWNNRTRDAASIVRWIRRQTERHVNWQIVKLDSPLEDLRESPILYAASDKPTPWPEAQWHTLKRYLDEGGVLLVADEGNGEFAAGVEETLAKLYPQYQFRDLPKDHPYLTGNFPADKLDVRVRALGNGVRDLVIVLPEGDMPWRWQRTLGTSPTKSPDFSLVGNIVVSVTGRANLRFKGNYHLQDLRRDAPQLGDDKLVRVGRFMHSGNWNAEPAAYTALAARLHNQGRAKIRAEPVSPSDKLADFHLIHLAATHVPTLSDSARDSLRNYLNSGGTVLIEAVGGDADVGVWAESLASDLLPNTRLELLPSTHPIYTSATNAAGEVQYRPAAADRVGARRAPPRLRGITLDGRLALVVSTEDLSAAAVGFPHDHIIGYEPDSARQILGNLLQYAARLPLIAAVQAE